MVKIQFVHTSDWHLGYTQYNKIERNRDFKDAALKLVDEIINIKPDFVLHTGDVFHLSKPSPSTKPISTKSELTYLPMLYCPIGIIKGSWIILSKKALNSHSLAGVCLPNLCSSPFTTT